MLANFLHTIIYIIAFVLFMYSDYKDNLQDMILYGFIATFSLILSERPYDKNLF